MPVAATSDNAFDQQLKFLRFQKALRQSINDAFTLCSVSSIAYHPRDIRRRRHTKIDIFNKNKKKKGKILKKCTLHLLGKIFPSDCVSQDTVYRRFRVRMRRIPLS